MFWCCNVLDLVISTYFMLMGKVFNPHKFVYWVRSLPFSLFMYLKEKQYKIAMILLCPGQGPWASSFALVRTKSVGTDFHDQTNGRFSHPKNSLIWNIYREQTCPDKRIITVFTYLVHMLCLCILSHRSMKTDSTGYCRNHHCGMGQIHIHRRLAIFRNI